MKKFKFKLEPLLRLRKFEEEKCKIELGRIQQEILRHQKEIEKEKFNIGQAHSSQIRSFERGSSGREARVYPMIIEGKTANIGLLKKSISLLEEKREQKLRQLNQMRGKVKVLDSLKEKHRIEFLKEEHKKSEQEREDLLQMRLAYGKRRGA